MRVAASIRHMVAASIAVLVLIGTVAIPSAQNLEPVSLRLDWSVISYHTPFYLGVARGYYKDAGLALTIGEGKGSSGTVQLVGNGADTFGYADAAVVAKAISLGVPVKMVSGILRKSSMALVFPGDSEIQTPRDLKGKRVSTCAGQATGVLLPAYLAAVGLSPSDVRIVTTQCGPPIYQAVMQKQADAAASYGPPGHTYFTGLGAKTVRRLEFADVGIFLPAHGMLTSTRMIETKPETVRRFVGATVKSWLEARKNPDAAVEATVAALPLLKGKESVLKAELEDYLRYVNTPATADKPFGWQSPDDWKQAENVLAQHMELKRQPSLDAYFTNDFLPK
jgi:NitT/TauT family transport system substrate-binding protein